MKNQIGPGVLISATCVVKSESLLYQRAIIILLCRKQLRSVKKPQEIYAKPHAGCCRYVMRVAHSCRGTLLIRLPYFLCNIRLMSGANSASASTTTPTQA